MSINAIRPLNSQAVGSDGASMNVRRFKLALPLMVLLIAGGCASGTSSPSGSQLAGDQAGQPHPCFPYEQSTSALTSSC